MECIYKNISLDIHKDITSQLTLSVKQGDTARGIRVALTDHGRVFKLPDNCYAVFSAKKSNGIYLSDSCVIQGDTIIYNFSAPVVSVAAQFDCELTVYSAKGERITSPSFMVFVYKTIEEEYASSVVESNDFTVLNDLIATTTETIAEANEAIDRVNTTSEKVSSDVEAAILNAESRTEAAITEAYSATNEARASVNYIRKTSDGKLQILDADLNVIDAVDVCYMDNDTIYRYNDGVLSVRGIKELNADDTYRMWVGNHTQFLALTEIDEHTAYWITDDTTYEEITTAINNLNETFTELETSLLNGSFVVAKAAPSAVTKIESGEGYYYIELGLTKDGNTSYCSCGVVYWDGMTDANSPITIYLNFSNLLSVKINSEGKLSVNYSSSVSSGNASSGMTITVGSSSYTVSFRVYKI